MCLRFWWWKRLSSLIPWNVVCRSYTFSTEKFILEAQQPLISMTSTKRMRTRKASCMMEDMRMEVICLRMRTKCCYLRELFQRICDVTRANLTHLKSHLASIIQMRTGSAVSKQMETVSIYAFDIFNIHKKPCHGLPRIHLWNIILVWFCYLFLDFFPRIFDFSNS